MSDDASNADPTEERRPSIGAGWQPAPDAAKEIRNTVLRHVEAQRASLEQLRNQIQRSQMDQEGGDALDWIEQRLTFLDGIEATANSAPLPALLSLSFAMPAIATATATVLSAAKSEAAMQIGTAMAEMSTEAYHQYSHALEARVRNTDAANGRHFQSAMGTLDHHGLGGHFRSTLSNLEAEREAAENRGEHGKARVADSLIGRHTLYAIDRALELETDPEKRAKLESERQRQIDVVAEREAAQRKQLQLDGLSAAQQDGLKGKDAEDYARGHVDRQMKAYRERDEQLYRADGSPNSEHRQETEQEIERRRMILEGKMGEDLHKVRVQLDQTRREWTKANAPLTASASAATAVANEPIVRVGLVSRVGGFSAALEDSDFGTEVAPIKEAASPTKLAEAKAQVDAQTLSKSNIKADESQDKRTDPSPPTPTPSGAAKGAAVATRA